MEKLAKREWKVEALRYLLWMSKYEKSEFHNRHDDEYYDYLRRFFFGKDGKLTFDCRSSETFMQRLEARDLPMPRNIYLFG